MRLPISSNGWSVDDQGGIHTRWAQHGGRRTRTPLGVKNLLDGKRGKVCKECFPSPVYPEPPRAAQKRRVPKWTDRSTD